MKNKKNIFILLVWNSNWNWNWDGSWNDLRECQKLWGGLCILHRTYNGSEAPPITIMQNTQLCNTSLQLHQQGMPLRQEGRPSLPFVWCDGCRRFLSSNRTWASANPDTSACCLWRSPLKGLIGNATTFCAEFR